jgi:anti-sigma factor (TIGR02949 family)
MQIGCDEVLQALTDFLEEDLTQELRARIEAHLRGCHRCTAAYDGVRNVLRLVADHRVLELPAGFSRRLEGRIRRAS